MRMNEQIRVPRVRLITETGEQLGVVATRDALERARSVGLDLMEVAPNETPPVCKIMDYGKYKYQQQKKEHLARKKQHVHEQKELRIRPKTEEHDIEIKLNKAREFLEEGSKVQFTMIFRGREQMHQDIGRETFKEIVQKLDDIGKIEREARMEGRRMIMILSPKARKGEKGGGSHSGGGKPKPEGHKPETPKPREQAVPEQVQQAQPVTTPFAENQNGNSPVQV